MAELTYLEAGHLALAEALRADPAVWALGEDLGRGGVFGQYKGLVEDFGSERIVDTPISEACIMGAAVGAAMMGTRPVVEMRFSDFALCAVDELVNQAAKARFMFGGQTRVPLVVRQPIGMWRSSAAQHSQSLESWYTHIPGLVVITPSTPADNYSLLSAAIRSDDPVVYMEHKNIWHLTDVVGVGREAAGDPLEEIGKARVVIEGDDVTVVTWSAMVHEAVKAVDQFKAGGPAVEVIDLRTLWPWDVETVLASVRKTGRLLVVHEAVQVGGFGAEIAATMAEKAFADLKAPVKRLGAPRILIGYAPPLENEVKITAERDIAPAIRILMEY